MADFFEDKFEDHYVDVNGMRLHYTDWGGNSDKPLLLVHGFNVQLHTWDPIADHFRNDYHVYCVDLRGHGDSDWACCGRADDGSRRNDGYALNEFVSDIYEVAKKLDIIPFTYMGHSLGSRIGIGYAGAHPETVRRVILSDTGPEVPRAGAISVWNSATRVSGGDVKGFRTEEEVREFYAAQTPEWKPIFLDLHARYQVRRNWADRLVFKADPDVYWITGSASLKEVPHLWEMASRITAPTLIAWGETSHLVNQELVDRMLATMPNARAEMFHTGHQIAREQPEEFLRVATEFLAE